MHIMSEAENVKDIKTRRELTFPALYKVDLFTYS